MGNGVAKEDSWIKTFDRIRNTHDLAYTTIEEAITLEEQEKQNEAIEKYKEGIFLIDKALNIHVTCPENPDFTWERARSMIQKMKKTRAEVLMRITSIQSSPAFVLEEEPPSYDEAVANCQTSDGVPRTYIELASALNDLHLDPSYNRNNNMSTLYSHDNVMLYFISPTGEVMSTSQPQTLNIWMSENANSSECSSYYLQVGEWVYPLIPGVSPCYRTDYGAFILPNVHSDVVGSSIGLMLPSDVDPIVYEILESILHGIVQQTPGDVQVLRSRRDTRGTASTLSNYLVNGAWHVHQGLVKGAHKVDDLLNYTTPKLMNRIIPANQPSAIPPKVSTGIKIAGNTTSTAANVTGFVADKVGTATMKLGRFLAPHIEKQGTRLLTSGFRYSEEEASNKMKGVLTVAAGAVEGFSTVYRGLESSATILGSSLKHNTVKIVQYKYGQPAGEVTGDTFDVVGNVWNVSNNIKVITPKGLAKRTVKDTGKAVIQDYRRQLYSGYENGNDNDNYFENTSNDTLSEKPSTSKQK